MNSKKTLTRLPTRREPIHPGIILLEEFMVPYDITQQEMAGHLLISRKHLIDLVHARKPVSLEIAQRLAKFFRTSIDFWIQGQIAFDIWHAMHKPSKAVKIIKPIELNVN